jgi:hypothetical protein
MASRTQIRQQQLTGSTVDIKARLNNAAATNNAQPNTAALLTGSSQLDIFGYVGAALHRIHGASSTEPFNNAVSTLSDGSSTRITYVDGQATVINSEGGTEALTIGQAGAPGDISVTTAGALTVTTDLAVNGNATIGNQATDSHTFNGDTAFVNDVEIRGDLKVIGDTTTTYISSSIVELQDPVLVTNASDFSTAENATKARKVGTSFLSASSDIENAAGTQNYDYGLIYKRAIGYNAEGAGNGVSQNGQIKSLATIAEGGNEKFGTSAIGSVFGVFKTTGIGVGGDLGPSDAGDRSFNLDSTIVRNGARNVDILGAHLGAFAVVSSSAGNGKKRFGVIKSVDTTNNRVQLDMLASTELYDGLSSADQLQDADMGGSNEASVQLLSAYAGTIFDKESFEFHHAAAAITGSGDNKFISGSANIMLYGGINSAKITLHQNNLVSGSMVIGDFDLAPESEESAVTFTRLQSTNAKELMLKSAGDLILSASSTGRVRMVTNDGSTIKFPTGDGAVDQIMKTDGSGQLSFAGVADLVPALSRAMMRVKPGVTIAAGVNGLILTGAQAAANSEHFITASSGLSGDNADKINALTDAELFSRVSLFVNGQLLVSGSGTTAGVASDADYVLKRVDADRVSGSFAFDLEEDDTITLIVQAKS